MELDAAVGIVSLVIQGCELSAKIYSKYRDQQNEVSRLVDVELERELDELHTYIDRLIDPPALPAGSNQLAIIQHQQSLRDLSIETAEAIRNLSCALEELKPKPGQSKLESLIKAGKYVARAKKLQQLKDEVDACRDRTLLLFTSLSNEKHDLSLERQTDVLSNQEKQFELSQQLWADVLRVSAFHHTDLRTLILEMKDGRAQTIESGSSLVLNGAQAPLESSTVTSFSAATLGTDANAITQDFRSILGQVKKCLHFERLSERQHVIREAHFATFHWIFEEDCLGSKVEAFSSFPRWLEEGYGCYWIQGKAGSGKSTLVKRIHEHEQTRYHLLQWCGDSKLLAASFFFWYMGSSLQKTMEGMIRSLLFAVLENAPQMVLNAMPGLFLEAMKVSNGEDLPSPTLAELFEGFDRLLAACEKSQKFKLCFFVDGLDEASDNKAELANFFTDLASKHRVVKFVLSSRPLADFVDVFSELPGLRVQDLTQSDIEDYTRSLIPKDRYAVSEEAVKSLIDTISERSQGVFLWVTVVVRTVLEGLRHGDTVAELQERVTRLPAELKDLYKRMLQDIESSYRAQAAEMLLLVAISFDPMHPKQKDPLIDPFPAIQLSFALDGCAAAVEAPIEHFSDEEVEIRVKQLEPRLRSRCLGLLELRDCRSKYESHKGPLPGRRLYSTCVEPFHRTAVEFLLDEEVSRFLRAQTRDGFDAFDALFCSTVRMAKIAPSYVPTSSAVPEINHPPWHYLFEMLFLATDAARRGSGVKQDYINELERVMSTHWAAWARAHAPSRYHDSHWMSVVLYNRKSSQGDWIGDDTDHVNLCLDDDLCAQLIRRCSYIGYLRIICTLLRPDDLKLLIESGPLLSSEDATLLLRFLIQTRFNPMGNGGIRMYLEPESHLAIATLFSLGADPNARETEDPSLTIWSRLLLSVHDFLMCKSWAYPPDNAGSVFISIVEDFVSHDADLSVTVRWRDDPLPPSTYVYTLHLLAIEGLAMFEGEDKELGDKLVARRFRILKEALEQAAHFLRAQEDKAGIHSYVRGPRRWLKATGRLRARSAGMQKGERQGRDALLPLRMMRTWASRSKSMG